MATDLQDLIYGKTDKKICNFDSSSFRSRELLNRETYRALIKVRFMAGSLLEEDPIGDDNNSDDEDEKKLKEKKRKEEEAAEEAAKLNEVDAAEK